jgi:hypothetical protein
MLYLTIFLLLLTFLPDMADGILPWLELNDFLKTRKDLKMNQSEKK